MADEYWEDILNELSDEELDRLYMLLGWIRGAKLDEWRRVLRNERRKCLLAVNVRPAPSIITRSEAELFGISTPRFAFRVTMRDESGLIVGFANLRRISSLRNSIGRRLNLDASNEFLTQFHRRCRSLGDSFFSPTHRWPDHCVITTDLSESYGEEGPAYGVPFVTHFPIGGGMCAQAVCFQATSLVHRIAQGVFGVSEVTCLAQASSSKAVVDDGTEVLDFSGLKPDGIVRYFRHPLVGLEPVCQEVDLSKERQVLGEALTAYVRSGIPVIIAVNMAKLVRSGIYDKVHLTVTPSAGDHAILIVGCDSTGENFLVNDPASFPFLEISLDDLCDALVLRTQLIAILPRGVKRPLLWSRNDSGKLTEAGILVRAQRVPAPDSKDVSNNCGWYLDTGAKEIGTHVINPPPWMKETRELLEGFRDAIPEYRAIPFWVQVFPSECSVRVRLWDACGCDSTLNGEWPWLAEYSDGQWTHEHTSEAPTPDESHAAPEDALIAAPIDASPSLGQLGVRASVITSFSTKRSYDAFHCISKWKGKDHRQPVELYLWMQPDVKWILERTLGYVGRDRFNSVEMMASFCTSTAIRRTLGRLEGNRNHVAAIATFIPEISSDPESTRGQDAQKALEYVFRFAIALHEGQPKDRKLRVIECVAGSRIDDVYACMTGGTYPRLLAKTVSDQEAQDRLFKNLAIAGVGGLYEQMRSRGISLAIELEPGPLFVLRDEPTLAAICQRLGGSVVGEHMRGVIGVNLDIAHWRFAKIDPDVLKRHRSITDRISHCHMSGHHATAHFGDRRLLPSDRDAIQPWLKVIQGLQKIANTARKKQEDAKANEPPTRFDLPKHPLFSGLVSLEYEAAIESAAVRESLAILQQWIN